MTPNIGGFDTEVITNATAKLFDKIGAGIRTVYGSTFLYQLSMNVFVNFIYTIPGIDEIISKSVCIH